MWTLSSLLASASEGPLERSSRTEAYPIALRKGQKRFMFLAYSHEPYSDPEGHVVSLLYPNLIPFDQLKYHPRITPMNRRVRVACSCPAWPFWGSAYLSTREKYRLPEARYAENEPALIRDPEEQNFVCKHVCRVAMELDGLSFAKLLARAAYPKTAMHARADLDRMAEPITSFLTRQGHDVAAVEGILASLDPDGAEDVLESLGMLCEHTVADDETDAEQDLEGFYDGDPGSVAI